MPAPFYILFGALFTVLVMIALGRLLLRALGVPLYRQEELVLSFMAGAPVLSTLVFALCALGLVRKGVLLCLGAAILGFAFRKGAHRFTLDSLAPLDRRWKWFFGSIYSIYFVLYFFNALAPEISPDGGAYHLGVVARYLRERGFRPITTNMYATLSQGVEMLFLFAFAFGRYSAAAMVHFAFLLALPLMLMTYARRFGLGGAAGVCGALFVFVSPVAGIDGTSAYVDVAVACIAFAVFYLLQIWDAERHAGLLVLIGILAGFAYAAKYTAFVAAPYALAFIAWKTFRKRQPLMRPLLLVTGCILVMVIPWIARNWIWVGNPLAPLFNWLFVNPYFTAGFEREYAQYLRHYDLGSLWKIPLAVTAGGELTGVLGPLFLLAPAALVALRWPAGRQLLLAALVFAIPYPTNIGTRFLIPPLPFLSMAMALAFTRARGLAPALVMAHAILSWPSVIRLYTQEWDWHLKRIPIRPALRITSEDEYLGQYVHGYAITRLIERVVSPGEKVLTFSPLPEAYTSRDILVVYQAASNSVSGDIQWAPLAPEYAPIRRLLFRFPEQNLRRIRVVQTASGAPESWSVTELRLLHRARELPREASWRLRAKPNPSEVQLAFDNSPVTRWRTIFGLYGGMFLEVDLTHEQAMDSVLLECSRDQAKIKLKLEGADSSGQWKTLADGPRESQGPPVPNLRYLAAEELKRRGINYIVVFDADYYADDYRRNRLFWNMALAGETGKARLYRLP